MASEEGYLALELGDLSLAFNRKEEKELNLKVEVEITKVYEAFRWKASNEPKYSSENFIPVLREAEGEESTFNYLYGFQNLFLKSGFIELNNDVFNALVNTSLIVRIINANDTAEAALAAAGGKVDKKGKGPAVAAPVVAEPLVEIRLPFSALTSTKGGVLDVDLTFDQFSNSYGLPVPTAQSHVDLSQSSFQFKLMLDTCVGEFLLGSKVIKWANALFSNFPHTWSLHAPDVVDPKAKVPPTAAELRAKYLENIVKHVQNQSKIASYTITVGTSNNEADSTVGQLQLLFPAVELANGQIEFDEVTAKEIPVEEDIRSRADLWKVSWESSSNIFLHRSQVRQLNKLISNEPDHAYIPLTLKKTPTAEGMANELGEVFATAVVDVSSIITPGETILTIPVTLQGELMDAAVPKFSLDFVSENGPLQEKAPIQVFKKPVLKDQQKATVNSGLQVSSKSNNRDVVQELRDEISKTLERVAQEYVAFYPQELEQSPPSPKSPKSVNNNGTENYRSATDLQSTNSQANNVINSQNNELEERKEKFIQYIINNGIFQELQENLRLKVQILIKDRYGQRGRALGKSEVLKAHDVSVSFAGDNNSKNEKDATVLFQNIISELYVFIMKEVNLVMNTLFKTTVIQKDLIELNSPSPVNDEQESDLQIFQRLLRQGQDAAADGKYELADKIFLERLQLTDHCVSLGSNEKIVHSAYSQYADYLLKRAAFTIFQNSSDEETYQSLLRKAREALVVAYNKIPDEWETTLLYANVLIQLDQLELAENILLQVLSIQLNHVKTTPLEMDSFNQFSGYESDSLYPVHPKCYAVLASYLYLQGKQIESRKALLLANRSYVEGGFAKIPITSHGRPRRTLVLILSEAALYLYQYGLFKLADVCVALAKDSEQSCTEKAQARDKPSVTPPFIQAVLKLAQSESAWSNHATINDEDAIDFASQAFEVADTPKDRVLAKLAEAKAFNHLKIAPESLLSAYIAAVQEAINNIPLETMIAEKIIPLETFVTIGKYLIYSGYFIEAVNILLYGAAIYSSATLCFLLGLSYLRLDRFDEAEDCLIEGNILDHRHVDIWAYLSMINLQKGIHRLPEAERCLFQTLRLGQSDPSILRELATAFVSVDKLQTAEDLIRRTIAVEIQLNSNNKANAHTRKMLADILAGQNFAAKAIEEYKLILIDDGYDWDNKLQIAEKCSQLLIQLGREEEIQSLKNIMENIRLENESTFNRIDEEGDEGFYQEADYQ